MVTTTNKNFLTILIVIFINGKAPVSEGALQYKSLGTPINITEQMIFNIMFEFNSIRGKVQPTASNMIKLAWNKSLADMAISYSTYCLEDITLNSNKSYFQNNIGITYAVGATANYALISIIRDTWVSQKVHLNNSTLTCENRTCSDYFQIITAEVTGVGCGASRCPDVKPYPVLNPIFYVCLYDNKVTDENKLPYAVGIPCLLCRGLLTGHFVCQNNTCDYSQVNRILNFWSCRIFLLTTALYICFLCTCCTWFNVSMTKK